MSTSENTAHTLEPSPSAPAAKHHGLVSRARAALPYGAATLVGLAIGALVFAPHTPAQLEGPAQGGTVPVTEQALTDSRTVELIVTSTTAQPIRFAGSGTLTSVTCPEGNILHSGTAAFAVDGQNVVPLATATPLWRDLHEGDTGEDVRALQAELSRLGYSVGVDGTLGQPTLRAAGRLLGLTGTALNQYDTISQGSFLWIPAPDIPIAGCTLAVGATLEPSAEAFTTTSTLTSARIKSVPAGAVAGARKLVLDGTEIPLDAEGNVSGREALAALAATETFRWWDEDGRKDVLRASYQLAEPETAYAIAPAAIIDIHGTSGCVVADGTGYPVEIVSSELGSTRVRFTGDEPVPSAVELAPKAESCG